jgi:hypothetical protein
LIYEGSSEEGKTLGPNKKEEGVKMKSRSGDEPRKFDADILR